VPATLAERCQPPLAEGASHLYRAAAATRLAIPPQGIYNAGMPSYTLRVNGRTHEVEGESADSLLSVLRYEMGLTGSKFGCGEGHCGACTVLVDNQVARSCVTRLAAAAGTASTTIAALADGDRLPPVPQAFLEAEAFQCGYCTPGMVMATVGLLRTTPTPSEQDIAKVMDRNVCRCGTYPRIVRAVKLAAERLRSSSNEGVRR
jgi:nicotinate dehydrogenase subunit A